MKKLYEKSELTFAIIWIVLYCVLQSVANPLNKLIGIEYSASAVFCILQTIVLLVFILKNKLQKRYGLCKSPVPAWRFLFYLPLLILASGNLWNGVKHFLQKYSSLLYIYTYIKIKHHDLDTLYKHFRICQTFAFSGF